jgi:L-lactate dehydrogenase (cytochrome)
MSGGAVSIGRYFTEMLDPSMNWDDVAEMVRHDIHRFLGPNSA